MRIDFLGKYPNEKQKAFVYKKFSELDLDGRQVSIEWKKNNGLHWVLTTNINFPRIEIKHIGKKFYSLVNATVNELKEMGLGKDT